MSEKKRVALLGSTGSIGRQTLEVIQCHSHRFEVEVLTAQNNGTLLIQQALEFLPNAVVIGNEALYQEVKSALEATGIKVYAGERALAQVVEMDSIDVVLTALVGYAGLIPTIKAIESGKPIALANKETLVVAGELISQLAQSKGVNIYPVDSEHSAIFQCLMGEFHNPIEKLILTASGGPFRGRKMDFLKNVSKEQALKHPNWDMGPKITIDSATLMNKGLEVIEAKWLFGVDPSKIEVVVHPQSIIHSLVQFEDGSIKAQLGIPDMRIPIQFALTYPERFPSDLPRFDFSRYPEFTFEQPDLETFRNLQLAYDALEMGGNAACILNAANEVVVDAFLEDMIGFLEMSEIINETLHRVHYVKQPSLDDYIETDKESRIFTKQLIFKNKK